MEELEYRRVTTNDLPELQKIARETFLESFSADNSETDMDKYLDEKFNAITLAAELGNPGSEFYFAHVNEKVIGYLKLNFMDAQTEIKDLDAAEVERIYVKKEYLGKKAGQFLMDKALQVAGMYKLRYVWLGVWEQNLRAIRFYDKNGFSAFDKHIFRLGADEQTDIMMKKVL
jgi:ribosomal protein S18 acetylase RimI-like enzyme